MKTRGLGIPIWLMGMCNLSYGFYNGIISFALPQMLAARHVPLQQIAMVSAGALSADISISITACALMGLLLFLLRKPKETAANMTVAV